MLRTEPNASHELASAVLLNYTPRKKHHCNKIFIPGTVAETVWSQSLKEAETGEPIKPGSGD